jgi:hypothetical protein
MRIVMIVLLTAEAMADKCKCKKLKKKELLSNVYAPAAEPTQTFWSKEATENNDQTQAADTKNNEQSQAAETINNEQTSSDPDTKKDSGNAVTDQSLSVDMQNCLEAHNIARRRRQAAELVWSFELANSALAYAQTNPGGHSGGPYGENLYWSSAGPSCEEAANAWISEYEFYNGQPIGDGDFGSYGHFTQICYGPVRKVGCGVSGTSAVCHYDQIQLTGATV